MQNILLVSWLNIYMFYTRLGVSFPPNNLFKMFTHQLILVLLLAWVWGVVIYSSEQTVATKCWCWLRTINWTDFLLFLLFEKLTKLSVYDWCMWLYFFQNRSDCVFEPRKQRIHLTQKSTWNLLAILSVFRTLSSHMIFMVPIYLTGFLN